MARKILVMGLPGAGKTRLSEALAPRLGAVHFNNDDIRRNINKDLGFSVEDRLEQARRMGHLCDLVVASGGTAIADFVCPTEETRNAFGSESFVVWVDRIEVGRFADTNALFEPPVDPDVRVTAEGAPEFWAEQIVRQLRPVFDPKAPTALFIGRYQPFHDGHRALIEEGLRRVGQVCIAVRDTGGTDPKNPLGFHDVRQRIEQAMSIHEGRFLVLPVPNITDVFYGRDVGWNVEQIVLDSGLQAISATGIRQRAGL
ncbi:adenylyl-sulfate kinase [uncultured Enterovirga sp.]|uniref:adenylyl-sulfate kinase n=1 Tax=uncultured Enterovirga sp. TaxID=2026352 RepID=UPI0035CB9FBD